jgi:hypothetical protein
MKFHILIIVLITISGCSLKEKQINQQHIKPQVSSTVLLNYDSCKTAILLNKKKWRPIWHSFYHAAREKIFTSAVIETIVPSWIGTAWDFNGTSEKPKQGSIACGYFVTTVLRDAGLPIARTRLAQCASEQMITSLVQSKYISHYRNVLLEDFIQAIQKQGNGLFIVGLDKHTGLFTMMALKYILYIQLLLAPEMCKKKMLLPARF